jgi:NADH-quinone oxidoreductase subunit I
MTSSCASAGNFIPWLYSTSVTGALCAGEYNYGKKRKLAEHSGSVVGLAQGFAMTFRLFRGPLLKKTEPPTCSSCPARIIFTRDPDGGERCVACYLCSAVCPVSCISMQGAEKADGRRWAPWFRINFARCIYCGLCEEACPTRAIQLTPDFETCQYDILTLVAEKADLLVDHGGKIMTIILQCRHYRQGDKGTHIQEAKP